MAISPETPDQPLSTTEKHKLEFTVPSDFDSAVARSFGIACRAPDYLIKVFENLGWI